MSWERSTKCVGKKVFEWVGQKWHTILPIRDLLISPEIQSSSTFILSFQSIKPKTRCFIQMSDIDNHKYLVNISQTNLAPALVPRFQLTQVQHLHSVSNSFEALFVLLGLLSQCSASIIICMFSCIKRNFSMCINVINRAGLTFLPHPLCLTLGGVEIK